MSKLDHFNIEVFKDEAKLAIQRARTLDEIESWFQRLPFARSVELRPHLLKSHPPQRELVVEIITADKAITTMMVHFFELGNQRYQFNALFDMNR